MSKPITAIIVVALAAMLICMGVLPVSAAQSSGEVLKGTPVLEKSAKLVREKAIIVTKGILKTIDYNGNKRIIETCGDLWGFLQEYKFHSSQQPYYVVLDNSGNPMTPMMGFTENVDEFKEWLKAGLDNYKK